MGVETEAQTVVLQAPLPDATVGIVAGAHSVDGVDVPLPPSRHLERVGEGEVWQEERDY